MTCWVSLLVLLVTLTQCCHSARILAVLPMPATSHHNFFRAIFSTLAERGHEVVSYTPLPQDKPVANHTEVFLDILGTMNAGFNPAFMTQMMNMPRVAAAVWMWNGPVKLVEETFKSEPIKQLLNSKQHFDLVLLEAHFAQEALLVLGHKFKAPVVLLQPFGSYSVVNKLTGNDLSLTTIPDFSFPFSDKMSFYERAINSYSLLTTLYFYYTSNLPCHEKLARDFYEDDTMPSVSEMVHNISLVVNNVHPFVHYAQPNTPNIVSIGGIHLTRPSNPLPTDMKRFMDEAKDGVVYFSLGSFLPDQLLPQSYFDNFINVFRRLPQRIIWKTGYEDKNLPDNILTVKWAPQQELLAHPKTVLFMTHGGLFSQHEAIHAGVPVVCIPFFGDQPMNAKFYVEKGIGVELLYESLSESTIDNAINKVLHEKRYQESMRQLSLVYRDRPVSASDSLVFWVEYVLRHKGAAHLRPVSSLMPWYQLALLDVLAAVGGALSVVLLIVYIVVRKILSRIFHKHNYTTTVNDLKKRE